MRVKPALARAAASLVAGTALVLAAGAALAAGEGRLVYLAVDGLGASEVEAWIAAGALPHLTDLRARGGYARLTPSPPASEEALWATFAVGAGAGTHGIFDFTVPDFATHRLLLADADLEPPSFRLGTLLKSPPRALRRRAGTPFWRLLDARGVPVELLFIPLTFPPDTLAAGRMIAGLGTPDLRLTRSTFTVLTARDLAGGRVTVPGGQIRHLEQKGKDWIGKLEGPLDPRPDPPARLTVEVSVRPDPNGIAAHLEIGGIRKAIRKGEWAGLLPVTFAFSPLVKASGWVRPYLLATSPLSVYLSPVSFDAGNPYIPFSYPRDFAESLTANVGPFETLGWVEDTSAFNAGVLRAKPFLECVQRALRTRTTLVERELARTDWRFLAAAFLAPDRVAHTFYRDAAADQGGAGEGKAARAGTAGGERRPELLTVARRLDELVGTVAAKLGENDRLVVFSTHGMGSFRRGFNLNTWLAEEGYLRAAGDSASSPGEELAAGGPLAGVDWASTRAYGLGNGAIYLNRAGRDAQGTVTAAAAGPLAGEIAAKLEALVDGETGVKPILEILRGNAIFRGPVADRAPDLVLVYRDGYSTSWGSLLGGRPPGRFADNPTLWSGEHASADPDLVAGFVLADRPLAAASATVADLAVTALAFFGLEPPAGMEGRPLLAPGQ